MIRLRNETVLSAPERRPVPQLEGPERGDFEDQRALHVERGKRARAAAVRKKRSQEKRRDEARARQAARQEKLHDELRRQGKVVGDGFFGKRDDRKEA